MLRLSAIQKTFNPGTINAQRALDGVSLHMAVGEFLMVIGGNGSGKSSLLSAIAGVFPIGCGSIHLDGEDITALPENKRAAHIGRVFQDPMTGTAPTMTILENMALAARRGLRRGLRRGCMAKERNRYRDALAQLNLGLEDRLDTRIGLLSGGQRQALTLLMATLQRPKLLLLDEHTAALDPKTAASVLSLSARLVEENRLTTLMVTHNMRDAIRFGDRLIMMSAGRIVFDVAGEQKTLLSHRDLLERFAAQDDLCPFSA